MGFGLTLDQVSRIEEGTGTELFAWKPEGSIDPMEEDLVWLPEDEDPGVGYEEYQMAFSVQGTRPGVHKGPWATCYICRYDYPISQMVKYHGRYYCRPQKCYEDIEK